MADTPTPATNADDNKSAPAPRAAVSPSVAKWFWFGAFAVAIALILALAVSVATSGRNDGPKQERVENATPSSQQRAVDDCTYTRPCDGPKSMRSVPLGKTACFDPPVWADIEAFGFIVSSQGGPEHRFKCSNVDEFASGACKDPYDKFKFVPTRGTTPPRYYFVDYGQKFC